MGRIPIVKVLVDRYRVKVVLLTASAARLTFPLAILAAAP